MKYYRLLDDINIPEKRWFLKSLNVVDEKKISVWKFLSPAKVEMSETENLRMSFREKGIPLDFTFADFEVIVINEKIASFLSEEDCQIIPIEIEGVKNGHSYFVAILLNIVDCVDESRSIYEKWEKDDPIRPDLAGEYKSIYKLFLDQNKIKGNKIFRLAKSENIIIINDDLKKQFEKNAVSGVKFRNVS